MSAGKLLKHIIPAFLFLLIVFSWCNVLSDSGGANAGMTNAPGESNCTSCHSGTLYTSSSYYGANAGFNIPQDYIPDSTYYLDLRFYRKTYGQDYGFQVTALYQDGTSYKKAGTFIITDSTTTIKKTKTIGGSTREYVMQQYTWDGYWYFNWKAPSTNVGNITFYITLLRGSGGGSTNYDSTFAYTSTISPSSKLPYGAILKPIASPAVICAGDSISFEGKGFNNPISYKWTFTGPATITSKQQNPTIKFEKNGNYTARFVVFNKYGASLETTTPITVNALPADSITTNGPKILCGNDSIKLTAPAGKIYLWNTGQTMQDIFVKDSGKYSVIVTSSYGCQRTTKPLFIEKPLKPVLKLESTYGADTICFGDSVVLETPFRNDILYYNFIQNGFSYQNSEKNVFTAKNLSNGKHLFYLLATTNKGCLLDTTNKINVFVKNKINAPLLSVNAITSSAVSINWSKITGANGYEISTDEKRTWVKTTGTTFTKTGLPENEPITFYVRSTEYSKCGFSNIADISSKTLACKNISFNVSYDSIICIGQPAVINFSNLNTNSYAIKLNNESPTQNKIFKIWPNKDTVLSFTIFDTTEVNCTPINRIIKIKIIDLPEISIADIEDYCKGDNIYLNATSGLTNYIFFKNGKLLQNSSKNYYSGQNFENGDTVYVSGKSSNGCVNKSESKIIRISDRTSPGFTFNINNLKVQFTDTTAMASSRLWKFGDSTFSTEVSPMHEYAANGNYSVWLITSINDACKDSIEKKINVKAVGMEKFSDIKNSKIFPNPFNEILHVNIDSKRTHNAQILLSDLRGKSLLKLDVRILIGKNEFTLPTEALNSGIYILSIISDSDVLIKKVEKF